MRVLFNYDIVSDAGPQMMSSPPYAGQMGTPAASVLAPNSQPTQNVTNISAQSFYSQPQTAFSYQVGSMCL